MIVVDVADFIEAEEVKCKIIKLLKRNKVHTPVVHVHKGWHDECK